MYDAQIAEAVEAKLVELDTIPVGSLSGRRLEWGKVEDVDRRDLMRRTMVDIAQRVGLQFFQQIPVVGLEQFIIVSVMRDHDTAGLIKSVINSFLVAYCTPETTERAYGQLLQLEGLRKEVAVRRQLRQTPASPVKH